MFIITCYHIDSHKRWNRQIDKFFHNCLRCTRHRGHSSFLRTFFLEQGMQNEEYKMKNKGKNFTDEIVCMVYCSYEAMILLMAAKEKCRRMYGREYKEPDLCDRS